MTTITCGISDAFVALGKSLPHTFSMNMSTPACRMETRYGVGEERLPKQVVTWWCNIDEKRCSASLQDLAGGCMCI